MDCARGLGVLGLGNKTSVSNIEIGFSISFVSAERMHDMWIFEKYFLLNYLLIPSSRELSDTRVFE